MKKILLINLSIIALVTLLSAGTCNDDQGRIGGQNESPVSALEVAGAHLGNLIINTSGKIANLELKNTGSDAMSITDVALNHPLSFEGGAYPGKSGNCKRILDPGSSCSLALLVGSVSIRGPFSQEVRINYQVGDENFSKTVTVRADFKDLAKLLTSNLWFGNVNIGVSKTEKLHLRNASVFETIHHLSLKKMAVGSQFTIINPTSCATIAPSTTCELDIVFRPTTGGNFLETVDIEYESHGKKLSEKVSITASGLAVPHISVTGANFAMATTPYNTNGAIRLTVRRHMANSADVDAFTIEPAGLAAAGLAIDVPASNCTAATATLNAFNSCDFVLKSLAPIKANKLINQNIVIGYKVGGLAQTQGETLNGTLQIQLLEASGNNFGTKYLAHAGSTNITLKMQNPPSPNSSINLATTFKLKGLNGGPVPLSLNNGLTTCNLGKTLAPGASCDFVIEAKPGANLNNFAKNLTIHYKSGTEKIVLPVALSGNFNVAAPGAIGSLGIDIVDFNGQNFAPVNVVNGNSFDVTLTLTNNSATDTVHDFSLKPYDSPGTNLIGWPGFFIELSPASSCLSGAMPIVAGGNCSIILTLTPKTTFASNLGLAGRKFQLSYRDGGNHLHTQNVAVKGSWNFVAAPVVPATPPQAANNNTAPDVYDANLVAHPWYNYTKRPLKVVNVGAPLVAVSPQALLGIVNYPVTIWNLIPNRVYSFANHLPWTFNVPGAPLKLKDIVPDRIIDPTTGVRYIKLYHGTTSDVLANFTGGANGVRFDVSEIDALGQGWYLAANANESKNYGCERYHDRKAPHVNNAQFAILLVVGIEENDFIIGQDGGPNISYPKGHALRGQPMDPTKYFKRNNRWHNQFVFFSNVKPYVRIFEIIKLGNNFGMANGNNENDGFDVNNMTPDTNNAYRCPNY